MNLTEYINKGKIQKTIKKALSDDELKLILGKDLKLIMYPDLSKYNSIDELLPRPIDYCIILIIEDENKYRIEGHWTALLKYDGVYEFFDPYGNPPDYDLVHWMDKTTRARLNESKTYLKYLLRGKTYTFNRTKYEVLRKGVNTCGSHCAYRIYKFKKEGFTLQEYQEHMINLSKTYGLTYDALVAAFVNHFI
jgi:hypothetical protein